MTDEYKNPLEAVNNAQLHQTAANLQLFSAGLGRPNDVQKYNKGLVKDIGSTDREIIQDYLKNKPVLEQPFIVYRKNGQVRTASRFSVSKADSKYFQMEFIKFLRQSPATK